MSSSPAICVVVFNQYNSDNDEEDDDGTPFAGDVQASTQRSDRSSVRTHSNRMTCTLFAQFLGTRERGTRSIKLQAL